VFRWLLAIVSVTMVLLFVVTALRRLNYAYEYDWIEDGILVSVRHISSGLPLYAAPNTHFTPYLYTPIYFYVSLAVSRLLGMGYEPLRIVSILSTLGCLVAIYALVYTECKRHLPALAAAGVFASFYPVVDGSFDIGRVDMLYLCFVLWAFYATRRLNPALAALLWLCAFQTKQGVLPIAVLALCYDWPHPRRIVTGLGTFAVALAVSILYLTHATFGWYKYYVFGMAGSFGFDKSHALHFLPGDLIHPCGIALLLVLTAWLAAPPAWRSGTLSFYVLGSVGMIALTGYLRAHRGANVNSLLPMYAWISVLFGLALARLFAVLEYRNSGAAHIALTLPLLVAPLQMLQHLYLPTSYIPTSGQLQARTAFEQQLLSIPGDVLVLSHPDYAVLAGKPLFAGSESIGAVTEATHHSEGDELIQQYSTLLHSGTVKAVALDSTAERLQQYPRIWIPRDFLQLYPLRVPAKGADDLRYISQPQWIYLPCTSLALARQQNGTLDETPCTAAH
jgi:hypothetical protein